MLLIVVVTLLSLLVDLTLNVVLLVRVIGLIEIDVQVLDLSETLLILCL